jgi:exodeoxyribonuclease VII large subunit
LSIHYRRQGSAIVVLGNTYAYRDQLKALGARFSGADRNWRLPLTPANLESIAELCSNAGGGCLDQASTSTLVIQESSPLPTAAEATRALFSPKLESEDQGLTLRQLMEQVESAVTRAFPSTVWVIGEVQNLSRRGGHVYLDLAEGRNDAHANATTTVRAIIWSSALAHIQSRRGADKVGEVLQDGLQLRCLCQVQLYKDRGSITLIISDLDPNFTKGALALARERLLKELRAKGLDRANKSLPLPPFPLRLGLISAAGSRAKSDFLDQLVCLKYPGEVLFCSTSMQGEQVPRQVVAALGLLSDRGCDLIVITRGGGSAADLRWFDAPEIAYAIAEASIPIVAAIGHHDDVCVAEEICHMRQKTPTAAADYVVSILLDTRRHIDAIAAAMAKTLDDRIQAVSVLTAALVGRLHVAAERSLDLRSLALTQLGHGLQRTATARIHNALSQLGEFKTRLSIGAERLLGNFRTKIAELLAALERRDPSGWIAQGWTRLSSRDGLVKSVTQVAIGESLRARLSDGWLHLQVSSTEDSADSSKSKSIGESP